jgi:hypothetical protein
MIFEFENNIKSNITFQVIRRGLSYVGAVYIDSYILTPKFKKENDEASYFSHLLF